MRKVYSSDNLLLIGHLREVLESHRIGCMTRNEYLAGGIGELPAMECWPELWVTDDADHERASELVRAMLAIDMDRYGDWTCPGCGEPIEGQFSTCWQCGADRAADDPAGDGA